MWDVASGKQVKSVKHDDPVNAVAFSPDGKYLAEVASIRRIYSGGIQKVSYIKCSLWICLIKLVNHYEILGRCSGDRQL